MLKATQRYTRHHNTQLVLQTIYRNSPTSRAGIARATNLTRPTVSKIVSELQAQNLVVEIGIGESTGGKPPRLLQVNEDELYIISADIGNDEFCGALVNLYGAIRHRIVLPAQGCTGEEAVLRLRQLLRQLHEAADKPVAGIGIGSPGLIDTAAGVVLDAVNLEWQQLPLRQMLEDDFGKSLHVVNDSNAAALAEFTFGKRRESDNLVLLRLGKGVGAGIVLNGKLFNGDGSGAGEVGHVRFAGGSMLSFEEALSIDTLLLEARRRSGRDLDWQEFVDGVAREDALMTDVACQAAHCLGILLAQIIATLNVQNIVLSGPLCDLGALLKDRARQVAASRVLPGLAGATRLSISSLGTDLVLMGCSALVLHEELGVV